MILRFLLDNVNQLKFCDHGRRYGSFDILRKWQSLESQKDLIVRSSIHFENRLLRHL